MVDNRNQSDWKLRELRLVAQVGATSWGEGEASETQDKTTLERKACAQGKEDLETELHDDIQKENDPSGCVLRKDVPVNTESWGEPQRLWEASGVFCLTSHLTCGTLPVMDTMSHSQASTCEC